MTALTHLTACVTLALAAQVQDPANPKGDPPAKEPPPVLIPAPLVDDLKLDAEQKKKIDELEAEFRSKRSAAMMMAMLKIKTLMDKIERDEEPAPALAITSAITNQMLDLKRNRTTYEKKVSEVLTDEQRRKWEAWKKLKPKEKKERDMSRGEELPPAKWAALDRLPGPAYQRNTGGKYSAISAS
jgi:Spy/CpxP family protein refolding chaperone